MRSEDSHEPAAIRMNMARSPDPQPSGPKFEPGSLIGGGFGLVEAPLYDVETGAILFSDASEGGVWRRRENGLIEEVAPYRKGVGGMVRHADGGLVISGRNVSWRTNSGEAFVLLELAAAPQMKRFNDLTADAAGRLIVGALDYTPDAPDSGLPGMLLMVDLDRSARVVDTGVQIPNGMGVTVDGKRLYVADTGARTVWHYEIYPDGTLSKRSVFTSWTDARPDGLLVDGAGDIFIALRGPNCVCAVGPDGVEKARYVAPGAPITSIALGGKEGTSLYVTSGRHNAREGAVHVLLGAAVSRDAPLCRVR